MTPERLQEGLEWTWQRSYGWRSILTRLGGAPWSILPLWLSLNFGYRYYARHLPEKIGPVYRDPAFAAEARADRAGAAPADGNRSCGAAAVVGRDEVEWGGPV